MCGHIEISTLNEVGDVHRHFVNLGVVELLDVLKIAFVLLGDKVDGHSFTTETTSTPDPVHCHKTKMVLRSDESYRQSNVQVKAEGKRRVEKNQAGYTANTSCGRVGRGG